MKKRWMILLLFIFLVFGGFLFVLIKGYGFMVGRIWIQEGAYMVLNKETALYISVSDRMAEKLDKFSTGDEVLLVHGFVETSFPGQTEAKFVTRLSMGDESDLPKEMLEQFVLPNVNSDENEDSDMLADVPMVECKYEGYRFTLQIPEDWEYEIQEFTEEDYYEFGLEFWPKGEKEGKISMLSTKNFGVCGTDLKSETVLLGEYQAHKGTYDGNPVWDFIAFSVEDRDYIAMTEGVEAWWDEYGEEAMDILSTIQVYDEQH